MAQHIGDSQEFGTPDTVSSSGARVGMSHHEPSLDIGSSSSEEERERRLKRKAKKIRRGIGPRSNQLRESQRLRTNDERYPPDLVSSLPNKVAKDLPPGPPLQKVHLALRPLHRRSGRQQRAVAACTSVKGLKPLPVSP